MTINVEIILIAVAHIQGDLLPRVQTSGRNKLFKDKSESDSNADQETALLKTFAKSEIPNRYQKFRIMRFSIFNHGIAVIKENKYYFSEFLLQIRNF